MFQIKKKMF